jgi:hypothetical protein
VADGFAANAIFKRKSRKGIGEIYGSCEEKIADSRTVSAYLLVS